MMVVVDESGLVAKFGDVLSYGASAKHFGTCPRDQTSPRWRRSRILGHVLPPIVKSLDGGSN